MTDAANKPGRRPEFRFVLYKAGDTPVMVRAEQNLRRLCERYLAGDFGLEVVDILTADAPPLDVLAVPTVIRLSPPPEQRVIGDLSQAARAAEGLGLTDLDLID